MGDRRAFFVDGTGTFFSHRLEESFKTLGPKVTPWQEALARASGLLRGARLHGSGAARIVPTRVPGHRELSRTRQKEPLFGLGLSMGWGNAEVLSRDWCPPICRFTGIIAGRPTVRVLTGG
jgi:hypothetical protein